MILKSFFEASYYFGPTYSAPVFDDLEISAYDSESITIVKPTFSGNPVPDVVGYIGLNGTISVVGNVVNNFLQGPVPLVPAGYKFQTLAENTEYQIIAVATNSEGYDVKTIIQSTTVIAAVAPVLNDLAISSYDGDSITLTKPTLAVAGYPVSSKEAYIGLTGTISETGGVVSDSLEGPIDVSSAGYKFDELDTDTDYTIIVVVANPAGYSVKSIAQTTSEVDILGPSPLKFASNFTNSGLMGDASKIMIAVFYVGCDTPSYSYDTGQTINSAEALAQVGVNTIIDDYQPTESGTIYTLGRWLATGLSSVYYVHGSSRNIPWFLNTLFVAHPELAPVVIGWVPIKDETDGNYLTAGNEPLTAQTNGATCRGQDPTRPMGVNWNSKFIRNGPQSWYHWDQIANQSLTTHAYQSDMDAYASAGDVHEADMYSMGTVALYLSLVDYAYHNGIWCYGRVLDSMRANTWRVNPDTPLMMWLEDACPWENAAWACAGPTPLMMQQALKVCLVHGARAFGWFSHTFGNDTNGSPGSSCSLVAITQYQIAAKVTALHDLHAWIQGLAQVINSPMTGLVYYGGTNPQLEGKELLPSGYAVASSNSVPISGMVRLYDGDTYFFAMADGNESFKNSGACTGTFACASAAGKTITVRDESRQIVANGSGVWTDDFDPYEMHIYVWS